MPITKSAKKALRSSLKKKMVNDRVKRAMKDSIKKVAKLVKEKKAEAKEFVPAAYKAIDKALKKGVIKKNNAARKKSSVSRMTK
ncbi:MAG: 30S ribosomal protein S20 [Candidatus Pacebacteria bacterium]|jgi:small subunit ribosomal protein S20|nr:30S ribosomal protein S20 [Candidatus Paceibacterota bacterium]